MHTPGPWLTAATPNIGRPAVTDRDGWMIVPRVESAADARLIAAAPALLTALTELVGALEADAMDDKSNVYRSMMLSANHAIAIATED